MPDLNAATPATSSWVAPSILGGTNLISGLIQYWGAKEGMKQQIKENRRAERLNLDLFREGAAMESSEARKTRAFQSKEGEKERTFTAAENDKNRRSKMYETFLDRITETFNAQPQHANNIIQMNRGRR